MSFVHLHNHSDFSLLDGASQVPKMVARAKALGQPALALTDHGNMFGTLRFYKECKAAGIKPIVGCELYVAGTSRLIHKDTEKNNRYYHLVLLAKNYTGLQNLTMLSSLGYTEGFYYKPRVDWELLQKYHEGLICLSACLGGEIPQMILEGRVEEATARALEYQALYGPDHYYLELQDHGLEEQQIVNPVLMEISQKTGIPLVATNDCHYLLAEHSEAQDTLLCIGTSKKKNDSNRMSFGAAEFYLKSTEEMEALFGNIPEALSNTLKIADMVDLNWKLPGPLLPDYPIPDSFKDEPRDYIEACMARVRAKIGQTTPEVEARLAQEDTEYMVWFSNVGNEKRYPKMTPEVIDRLDFELAVIIKMGFVGYFLIVADFINWAKDHGVPVGPGRGSGAGSIVAYALRITDIDPLKYKLLFERFLNPERVSMPDFDVDFSDEGREDVIAYVTEKYGKDKVGQIITFGTLKPKAVLKDVARVLGIGFDESNLLTKLVPDDPKIHLSDLLKPELDEKWVEKGFVDNHKQLTEYAARGGIYRELFDTAIILEGLSRHASTHAAGVVIGKTQLTDYVPLYKDPKTGLISTQFTMDLLEECGLVKMDFLGLKTLTIIKHTLALLKRRGLNIDEDKIPEDDKATFKMLGEGKSSMIFQFESEGMQKVLRDAKPTSIEDLIALNALYRPGPMDYIPQFVDCKWGRKPIEYPHPSLEVILKETYGVIVYQEQVMQAAQIVAGYTLGGADMLRRAMGKKKKEEMDKQRALFCAGALKAHNIPEGRANEIFDILDKFAGYGFNKSHAAAYSVIAYKTAFLKANYPAEYLAANLTNEITNPDKLKSYLAEAKEMKIEVRPPNVNVSEKRFTVHEGKIVFGLLGVKNMGENAVDDILRAREAGPFTSFMDFLERVDLRVVNKRVFETGIQCGVFDGLGHNRATLFHNLDRMLERAIKMKAEKEFGQGGLFDDAEDVLPPLEIVPHPEWPTPELLAFEKELLGFFVSGHPLDPFREEWKKTVTLDLTKLAPGGDKEAKFQLLGIVTSLRVLITKKGAKMAFATLEDFRGTIDLVFFPKTFEQFGHMLAEEAVLGVKGKLEMSSADDKAKLIVDEVSNPEGLTEVRALQVHVRLKNMDYTESKANEIFNFFMDQPGTSPLYLHLNNGKKDVKIRTSPQVRVNSSRLALETYQEKDWAEAVWRE